MDPNQTFPSILISGSTPECNPPIAGDETAKRGSHFPPAMIRMLHAEFREVELEVRYDPLIYTGPIDEFFDYSFGTLPYRSLIFRHETVDRETFQPVAVVNYPSEDVRHTRITESKHLTGQRHPRTSVSYEFPSAEGDPYYPVPRAETAELFRRYQALADATPEVTFLGRLATYRYHNMDQVVAQALATYARIDRTRGHKLKSAGTAAGAASRAAA